MALTPTVLTDALIIVGASTISDHGNKVELNVTVVDLDTTAFGQTWMARVGGLKDGVVNFEFLNDFVAAQLDSIFWPLLGTVQTFEIRPTSAARAVGNPAYTGSILISEWKQIVGKVGDLATTSVGYKTTGPVLRQTS